MAQAAALKQSFEGISIMPPNFKLLEAMAVVEDAKQFERSITKAQADMRLWRSKSMSSMRDGLAGLSSEIAALGPKDAAEILLPLIDGVVADLDTLIEEASVPLHERPEEAATFSKLKSLSGAAGRFLRKQINRIEDIRVENVNTLVELRYGMLAFRADIDPDDEALATFSTPEEIGSFLRNQVA